MLYNILYVESASAISDRTNRSKAHVIGQAINISNISKCFSKQGFAREATSYEKETCCKVVEGLGPKKKHRRRNYKLEKHGCDSTTVTINFILHEDISAPCTTADSAIAEKKREHDWSRNIYIKHGNLTPPSLVDVHTQWHGTSLITHTKKTTTFLATSFHFIQNRNSAKINFEF